MIRLAALTLWASLAAALAACSGAADTPAAAEAGWNTLTGEAPQVVAHRGASGYRPEHTVSAFRLAFEQGADILEPDLMMSSDGQLIVRHDPYLSTSTDIADRPEFADRQRTLMGREDWWVMDFTADELRSLRARQVFADRSQDYNDIDPVMTLDDFFDLVEELEAECSCTIITEPEIKLPAEHAAFGLDPLPALLDALERRGLNREGAPVIVQSFDAPFLQRLRPLTPVTLAMLYYGPDAQGFDAGGLSLEEIAQFADAVGPHISVLLNPDGTSTGYLEAAHALGLAVHVWTVRDDRPPHAGESVQDELRALYQLGVDGVFTDQPDTAVAVRAAMSAAEQARRQRQ
ncbi:glycerophosphodiester phosphodiesterase [Alkalicaulis satelles]|uniref:glycerophosphodiester phosphodiesterase n=1 Tax=Alkalicaulis satelles TaxID=2609175 RepID=A0A5M6ZGX0_9PROT|nr:glycerophosphodiester phosphodiesterase family protein [Alkalicaulis satelles]KAA5804012.1 glycerophosphodiester phosphodiesterase [Alkalicaulis satelles]